MNNIYTVDVQTVKKMAEQAKKDCEYFFQRTGRYGHNNPARQTNAYKAEYAVRQLYRMSGINAHQNIKDKSAPDLTIPAHTTLNGEQPARQEEVKYWKTGNSFDNYFATIHEFHADKYARKERTRVWFCEVDGNTVVVHGWATPAEILQSETIITDSGVNYQVEVLHRVSEVLPNIEDVDLSSGWW
jgi:hypothetical protein